MLDEFFKAVDSPEVRSLGGGQKFLAIRRADGVLADAANLEAHAEVLAAGYLEKRIFL